MPHSLADEFDFELGLPLTIMLIRIVGAALLCGLIGLERGLNKSTAGLRTNMLIGLAVATFCIITLHMLETMPSENAALRLDPIRLVEAVTAGITFLAAGVIVYAKGDVKGLTTGASMWLSGAIGLACGLGLWPLALLATFAGVIVLWLLRRLQVAAGFRDD